MTLGRTRLFCVVALILLAACGGSPAPQATRTPADGPRRGGEVIYAALADVTTLNPYLSAGDAYEAQLYELIFPTLMVEQPDFQLHPPSFAPALATSWEFSEDNRVLTFRLRSDARWSDGVPVTAEDVRFTFEVQKDERLGTPGLEIKDFITDVEVVDPHTVRFHFSRVYPYQLMDANDGPIVPAHAWGPIPRDRWVTTDFTPLIVTAGPFRLANHVPGQTLVLERDPGWWGHGRPYLDRLVFRVIPDGASQLQQLLAGQVHLIELIPPREAERVRADPDVELVAFPGRSWGFVAWNNRNPLFADRRVRRALSLAINRPSIVATVYHGHARLATSPILSTMWAHNRNLAPLPFDPARARLLLAEAGWLDRNGDGVLEKDGRRFEFDLLYPSVNAIRRDIAVLMQADLERIGVRCRPLQTEYTAFLGALDSARFDASLSAWQEGTKIDLTGAWSTPSATQGSNNFYGYSNPEVDRLIAAAREESDYTRAKVILDRIQELIVEDQPVTFLYEADQLAAISRHVHGADLNSASVFFNVDEWYWAP